MNTELNGWIEIEHCQTRGPCLQRWDQLEPIRMPDNHPDIARFCAACQRSVFLCSNSEDYRRHKALGRCLALPVGLKVA